ncbi:MAG: hypothetical protein LBE12_14560 [Planctomycetaceae bacterium]|jgi:hypothetical protein|nr:hypothetical protein [Planctomycetaceae bacterium]
MTDQLKIKPVSYHLLYYKLFVVLMLPQIILTVFLFYCTWCDPIIYYASLIGIDMDKVYTVTVTDRHFYEDFIGLILLLLTIHVFTKRVIQHLLPSINEVGIEFTSIFYFITPSTTLLSWNNTTSTVWQTGRLLSIVLLKSQLHDREYFFFFLQANFITNKNEIIAFMQKLPVVSKRNPNTLFEILKFILVTESKDHRLKELP